MSGYTIAWIGWIIMFLAIEGIALVDKDHGNTLSEHVWKWFAVKDKPTGWQIRRIGLLFFLAWLVVHFLTGGWV